MPSQIPGNPTSKQGCEQCSQAPGPHMPDLLQGRAAAAAASRSQHPYYDSSCPGAPDPNKALTVCHQGPRDGCKACEWSVSSALGTGQQQPGKALVISHLARRPRYGVSLRYRLGCSESPHQGPSEDPSVKQGRRVRETVPRQAPEHWLLVLNEAFIAKACLAMCASYP